MSVLLGKVDNVFYRHYSYASFTLHASTLEIFAHYSISSIAENLVFSVLEHVIYWGGATFTNVSVVSGITLCSNIVHDELTNFIVTLVFDHQVRSTTGV